MAFHARRSLVIAARSADEPVVQEDSSFCTHARGPLNLNLQPAVSCLTDKIPLRRSCRLPFASITAAGSKSDSRTEKNGSTPRRRKGRKQHGEILMVASASESSQTVAGIPAWRVALGNIAAGATAGATVEADLNSPKGIAIFDEKSHKSEGALLIRLSFSPEALYPIDTIKTRLQASISGGGLRALLKGGGGNALYAGVWGNLAGVMPASAIFMGVYEPVKQHISRKVPENRQYLGALGGGALAGFAASFIRVPTEVVKQRLQTGEFQGAIQAIRSIGKTEGFRGLFAGYGSFLLRDLPFDAIEFVAYEQLKRSYKASLTEVRDPNSLETSAIGAIAGAVTGVVTTPLDVIKTRLMTQGSAKTYSGVFDCAQKIWQLEGPSAFLKGWQPRIIWIGLGGCVFFTALEEAKKLYLPKAAVEQQ